MISVWTQQDILPNFARLDYWTGLPLMIFADMLTLLACYGYEYLSILSSGALVLGAIFLFYTKFPVYLLEVYDENEEVFYSTFIDNRSYIFRLGLSRHEILSGPYFDAELNCLQQDLKVAEA